MMQIWITVVLTVVSVIVIPGVVLLIRLAVKWTTLESKLAGLVDDVKQIIIDKDKVHLMIMEEIKADRAASDRRLRWLEQHLWKSQRARGGKGRAI